MANTALPITAFTALTDIAEDEQVMIYTRVERERERESSAFYS